MRKGDETRDRIVERAFRLAGRDGLGGLTIGSLADELEMSKSGLFAHFGSKEDLQVAVLQAAKVRFEEVVLRPAFRTRRGEPRVRALFQRWLTWTNDDPAQPGGCIFLAAATELDDRAGAPRDTLVASQKLLIATVAKCARLAVEAGDFSRDLDCEQFAFELFGIVLAFHHARRLLRDSRADRRALSAFERVLSGARVRRI